MHILSDYSLEYKIEKAPSIYKSQIVLSAVSRVITVCMIVLSILVSIYFVVGIAVSLLFFLASENVAKKMTYTLKYMCSADTFDIMRIGIDGTEERIEQIYCCDIGDIVKVSRDSIPDIAECSYIKDDKCFYCRIESGDKQIYTALDKYMYALLSARRVK